jgi:hypothetical protein
MYLPPGKPVDPPPICHFSRFANASLDNFIAWASYAEIIYRGCLRGLLVEIELERLLHLGAICVSNDAECPTAQVLRRVPRVFCLCIFESLAFGLTLGSFSFSETQTHSSIFLSATNLLFMCI